MNRIRMVAPSISVALAFSCVAFGEDKKDKADGSKEVSVVPYDSKTQGALQVKSVTKKSGDWFAVLRDGKSTLANNPLLDSSVELRPATMWSASIAPTER